MLGFNSIEEDSSTLKKNKALLSSLNNQIRIFQNNWAAGNSTNKILLTTLAGKMLSIANQINPPVDISEVAKIRKVHSIILSSEQENKEDAVMIPDLNGFIIKIPENASLTRNRFSVAHEIGHTLFYDLQSRPPSRLSTRFNINKKDRKEEWICNDFAREILIPQKLISKSSALMLKKPSIDNIFSLSKLFRVSPKAICWRIFRDWRMWSDTAVFLLEDKKQTRFNSDTAYRGKILHYRIFNSKSLFSKECLQIIDKAIGSPSLFSKDIIQLNQRFFHFEVRCNRINKRLICLVKLLENKTLEEFS